MSEVLWPPADKVKYLGWLSVPDVAWLAVALGIGVVGLLTGNILIGAVLALLTAIWGRTQLGGTRIRTRARQRIAWRLRRNKRWTAPLRGTAKVSPMLKGLSLEMVPVEGRTVGVVRSERTIMRSKVPSFTVMLPVTCSSTTFMGDAEKDLQVSMWGDVLGAQCVERGDGLVAERITWTDVHRATSPHALQADMARFDTGGPASEDYAEYVAGFDEIGAAHHIVVSMTVSAAQLAGAKALAGAAAVGLARSDGRKSNASNDELLMRAVVSVGREIKQKLEGKGFKCGEFLRPVDVARLIVDAGDPFEPRPTMLTAKERFGLPERVGPNSVQAERSYVAIDNAFHRTFQLTWPKTAVRNEWMWRVLAVPGPKMVTTVFEAVAPSTADVQMDARASRQRSNSVIVAARKGGGETIADARKRAALKADEAATGEGHEQLDSYALIVMSARTPAELNVLCARLREALRESGRATVRELTGVHDVGFRLALPLGAHAAESRE